MQRTETYSGRRPNTRVIKDAETWLANSLATILAGLAVASGVIGLLVAFGYMNEDSVNPFQDGIIWLVGGIVLGLCANVFRREHHVVDNTEILRRGGFDDDTGRLSDERVRYDDRPRTETRYDERAGVPPHRHD